MPLPEILRRCSAEQLSAEASDQRTLFDIGLINACQDLVWCPCAESVACKDNQKLILQVTVIREGG